MKNYIPFSKEILNNTINKSYEASMKLQDSTSHLKSIASLAELNQEEIEILNKANEILIRKMEVLEDALDNENNQFYNIDDIDI